MWYGVGSAISALVCQFARAEPRPRIGWIALAVAAVFGSILLMWQSHRWQNELRALIGIDFVIIRQVNRVASRPVSIAVGIVDQADKASAISMR